MVVGLLMGMSRTLRAILDPIVSAVYALPKIAILPLVMLIFGIGEMSKIILVAVGMSAGAFNAFDRQMDLKIVATAAEQPL